jgi:carboxymethylenebutenolidase
MTQPVTVQSVPATFGDTPGALALPEGDQPAPGVVVLQEFWGVNDHIRSIVDRWAAAGFVALAPSLYRGQLAGTREEASKLMGGLDRARAVADIAGAVAALRAHQRCSGKIGVTGFCMGGAYAFAAATLVPGLSAVVPFYGVPPSADWSKVTAPVQAHFSATDDWAKPELARKIQDEQIGRAHV